MAPPLTGISSMATRQVLADLAATYESRTGSRIEIESVGGVDAARQVRDGRRLDVVVLASGVIAQLDAEGHLVAGSRADIARSGMAIAVPTAAHRPPIDTAEAVKQAMLNARAVCYSTGPSGDHLKWLWQQWRIADEVSSRALQAPPGVPVAAMLARGEADLGFQQLSELLDAPGVTVLGPLPPEIQAITLFSAAVASTSQRVEEARAFVACLAGPEADAAKRRRGMEPVEQSMGRDAG